MANYNQVGYGSQGDDVTELQKLLKQNGYNVQETGSFDSGTQTALKNYQEKSGLDADGIAGTKTWNALNGAKSPTVEQAQAQLTQQLNGGRYQPAWQNQLNDAISKILNREKFSYDLNGDALYQQYKDKYITQGQQAMMDTMGQAQAMTGGYGNSYAQMVGQQAYQGHLQQLNDVIPDLYQLALSRYQAEGDDLANRYAILSAQEGKEYDRYANDRAYEYQLGRDQIADKQWQAEFDEAIRQYDINHGIIRPVAGGSGGGTDDATGTPGVEGSIWDAPKPKEDVDVAEEYRQFKQNGESAITLDKYLQQMISEGKITKNEATELRNKRW